MGEGLSFVKRPQSMVTGGGGGGHRQKEKVLDVHVTVLFFAFYTFSSSLFLHQTSMRLVQEMKFIQTSHLISICRLGHDSSRPFVGRFSV